MGRTSEVTDGIYRLGDQDVNWYVIDDAGRLTIVDAGLPVHADQLPALLALIGRSLADVEAVLLTHHHPDHLGVAEHIRRGSRAAVMIHAADVDGARHGGGSPPLRGVLRGMLRPAVARYLVDVARKGAFRVPPIAALTTFADGQRLDVPGHPRVIHTPGHTAGECILLCEERGVLFSGDSLVTFNPVTGRLGPQVIEPPFVRDPRQAVESLQRIEATSAAVVLPGHGDPWREGAAEAVKVARRTPTP